MKSHAYKMTISCRKFYFRARILQCKYVVWPLILESDIPLCCVFTGHQQLSRCDEGTRFSCLSLLEDHLVKGLPHYDAQKQPSYEDACKV